MSRLTDAMAASLNGSIHYRHRLVGVSYSDAGVEAVCADGSRHQANRMIMTLPLPMLQQVKFDPAPPAELQAAWASVPYGAATSIFYPVKEPYWEADGLPPAIWSDSLIGRAFLTTNEQGPYIWFYAGGQNALPTFGWDMDDVLAYATQSLEAARPSLKGRLGDPTAFCWKRHSFAKATFASRAPGDLGVLQAQLKAPLGPIQFAGEHTADYVSGIEGALESGERAAFDVLSELI